MKTLSAPLGWMVLLLSLSRPGEGQPLVAHRGALDVGSRESQRDLILEAVKKEILSSLGMETVPKPEERASEQDLKIMHRLYREKLREIKGNSSQPMRGSQHSLVLFPATVEPIKSTDGVDGHPKSDFQWYRAIFHWSPNIHTELKLVRAELKIYRQLLDEPGPEKIESPQNIQVQIFAGKTSNSSILSQYETLLHANVSNHKDSVLDVRAEVERWRNLDGFSSLVMDLGLDGTRVGDTAVTPKVTLELRLVQPKLTGRRRRPRSNREDSCDEQGRCCLKSVNVSFRDVGWSDWVVAPAAYTMHYCDGSCPHNYKPASMHTQLKSRMHQMTKGATPRPCCVPAAYEPMILMHYDSRGKLKLTPFNDFIVTKCHCA